MVVCERFEGIEDEELVHVYPAYGREHVYEGLSCWCGPERLWGEPRVIVHRPEQ